MARHCHRLVMKTNLTNISNDSKANIFYNKNFTAIYHKEQEFHSCSSDNISDKHLAVSSEAKDPPRLRILQNQQPTTVNNLVELMELCSKESINLMMKHVAKTLEGFLLSPTKEKYYKLQDLINNINTARPSLEKHMFHLTSLQKLEIKGCLTDSNIVCRKSDNNLKLRDINYKKQLILLASFLKRKYMSMHNMKRNQKIENFLTGCLYTSYITDVTKCSYMQKRCYHRKMINYLKKSKSKEEAEESDDKTDETDLDETSKTVKSSSLNNINKPVSNCDFNSPNNDEDSLLNIKINDTLLQKPTCNFQLGTCQSDSFLTLGQKNDFHNIVMNSFQHNKDLREKLLHNKIYNLTDNKHNIATHSDHGEKQIGLPKMLHDYLDHTIKEFVNVKDVNNKLLQLIGENNDEDLLVNEELSLTNTDGKDHNYCNDNNKIFESNVNFIKTTSEQIKKPLPDFKIFNKVGLKTLSNEIALDDQDKKYVKHDITCTNDSENAKKDRSIEHNDKTKLMLNNSQGTDINLTAHKEENNALVQIPNNELEISGLMKPEILSSNFPTLQGGPDLFADYFKNVVDYIMNLKKIEDTNILAIYSENKKKQFVIQSSNKSKDIAIKVMPKLENCNKYFKKISFDIDPKTLSYENRFNHSNEGIQSSKVKTSFTKNISMEFTSRTRASNTIMDVKSPLKKYFNNLETKQEISSNINNNKSLHNAFFYTTKIDKNTLRTGINRIEPINVFPTTEKDKVKIKTIKESTKNESDQFKKYDSLSAVRKMHSKNRDLPTEHVEEGLETKVKLRKKQSNTENDWFKEMLQSESKLGNKNMKNPNIINNQQPFAIKKSIVASNKDKKASVIDRINILRNKNKVQMTKETDEFQGRNKNQATSEKCQVDPKEINVVKQNLTLSPKEHKNSLMNYRNSKWRTDKEKVGISNKKHFYSYIQQISKTPGTLNNSPEINHFNSNDKSHKKKLNELKKNIKDYKSKLNVAKYSAEKFARDKTYYNFSIKIEPDKRFEESANKIKISKRSNNSTEPFGSKIANNRVQEKLFQEFHKKIKESNMQMYKNNDTSNHSLKSKFVGKSRNDGEEPNSNKYGIGNILSNHPKPSREHNQKNSLATENMQVPTNDVFDSNQEDSTTTKSSVDNSEHENPARIELNMIEPNKYIHVSDSRLHHSFSSIIPTRDFGLNLVNYENIFKLLNSLLSGDLLRKSKNLSFVQYTDVYKVLKSNLIIFFSHVKKEVYELFSFTKFNNRTNNVKVYSNLHDQRNKLKENKIKKIQSQAQPSEKITQERSLKNKYAENFTVVLKPARIKKFNDSELIQASKSMISITNTAKIHSEHGVIKKLVPETKKNLQNNNDGNTKNQNSKQDFTFQSADNVFKDKYNFHNKQTDKITTYSSYHRPVNSNANQTFTFANSRTNGIVDYFKKERSSTDYFQKDRSKNDIIQKSNIDNLDETESKAAKIETFEVPLLIKDIATEISDDSKDISENTSLEAPKVDIPH